MKIKDYVVSTPTVGSKILGTSATGATENYSILALNLDNPLNSYKVFTALVTQNGPSDFNEIESGNLTIGATYNIVDNSSNANFTNVGAPNNNVGTYFIATGTTPSSWGTALLTFDLGAPVARVLANTIGNVWFTYEMIGGYGINSNDLFTDMKTTVSINLMGDNPDTDAKCLAYIDTTNYLGIQTGTPTINTDSVLTWLTPIEIRVYN
jgi:hypothetical protein